MIDRLRSRALIALGEYGIIAPNKDPLGISELRSYGFATCFALAVSDKEQDLALLGHIDIPSLCSNLIPESISILRQLGARSLTVQTANLANQRKNWEFDSVVLSSMYDLVDSYQKELQQAGFQVKDPVHLSTAARAVKVTISGIEIVSTQIPKEYQQILGDRADAIYKARMMQLSNGNLTPSMRLSYTPNLVLPSS